MRRQLFLLDEGRRWRPSSSSTRWRPSAGSRARPRWGAWPVHRWALVVRRAVSITSPSHFSTAPGPRLSGA